MENRLSTQTPSATFALGDTLVRYELKGKLVEFSLYPKEKETQLKGRRYSGKIHSELEVGPFRESFNSTADPLVQIAIRGEAAHNMWTAGRSMRNSTATSTLAFDAQRVTEQDGTVCIETYLCSDLGFRVCHRLLWAEGDAGVRIETTVENTGSDDLPVEMLSSFSLTGLTPFAEDDAPDRLNLHRFRSTWSNEALHEVRSFGSLGLERTWGGGPVLQRFGQAGSLPVRGYHPFIAVEDAAESVLWGATIAWHGSWQMEVYRRDDPVSLSGGLGDFESAHWMKVIAPGASFTGPTALVATCVGDIDDLGARLVDLQQHLAHAEPAHEAELPIIFNEWCSTWGKPSHDYLLKTADRLQLTKTKYLVIDDGWAQKPEGADIQYNGDWNVSEAVFPGGIDQTTAAIRERGLIPGLWFEFEPCTQGTEAFEQTDHHLQRHGKVLQVGNRHFWDFRDPWTIDYLTKKVIHLLRDNGFGYLKVDYNESIGIGCDGAESLGEGLRQHLVGVKAFFEKIRREVPGIVIENCASGGHRLEPGMVGVTSMSSFSDAHETPEIPIISAQLHRLIPTHKNQVWAVLRPDDSMRRLQYSLVATFLGRMCISGDLFELSDEQFSCLQSAQEFYQLIVPILRDGRSRLIDETGESRRAPAGRQALVRQSSDGRRSLIVIHGFAGAADAGAFRIPIPAGSNWKVQATFNPLATTSLEDGMFTVQFSEDFSGHAFLIESV